MATKTETVSLSLRATAASPPATLDAPRRTHEASDTHMSGQSDSLEWDASTRPGSSAAVPQFSAAGCPSGSAVSPDDVFSSEGGSDCSVHSKYDPFHRTVEELGTRALGHFPNPDIAFPRPSLEFDFRIAVKLRSESSRVLGRTGGNTTAPKEIIAISSGQWTGSFGNGRVMAGGYDLGQARGFRPIRIVEGAFVLRTTDEPPAILELRTRGSLSGPSDVLDTLLSPVQPKDIDPRKYGFRMFSTIKTTDERYAEIVNCALWIASGVWHDDELIIDAYRVT